MKRSNVTGEIEKQYIDTWKVSLKEEYKAFNTRFGFPSIFPNIRNFHVMDDKIFIITYKEKQGKNAMYIYSMAGKLLQTVYVPLVEVDMILPQLYNYYTIKDGKLYKLVEDLDKEKWELHISAIKQQIAGGGASRFRFPV